VGNPESHGVRRYEAAFTASTSTALLTTVSVRPAADGSNQYTLEALQPKSILPSCVLSKWIADLAEGADPPDPASPSARRGLALVEGLDVHDLNAELDVAARKQGKTRYQLAQDASRLAVLKAAGARAAALPESREGRPWNKRAPSALLPDALGSAGHANLSRGGTNGTNGTKRATGLLGIFPPNMEPVAPYTYLGAVEYADVPDTYTPFDDNNCFDSYPVTNQGECGSCYATASATMLSLRYCVQAARAGVTHSEPVVFGPQALVSCGIERMSDECFRNERNHIYSGGCSGGYLWMAMRYLQDYGLPHESCYPYVSGGGNPLDHFDAKRGMLAECKADQCSQAYQSAHPDTPMHFFRGSKPILIRGEYDMQRSIIEGGPLVCVMMVHDDFSEWTTNNPGQLYTVTTLDVPVGHAVVVYGWGVDPTYGDYWHVLNSWGSGWGEGGEIRMKRGINTAEIESAGCLALTTGAQTDVTECVTKHRLGGAAGGWRLKNTCSTTRRVSIRGTSDTTRSCQVSEEDLELKPGEEVMPFGFNSDLDITLDLPTAPPPPPSPPMPPSPPSPPSPPPMTPPEGEVPIEVTLKTALGAKEIAWEIDCKIQSVLMSHTQFLDHTTYKLSITLFPGKHSIKLFDADQDGWHGARLYLREAYGSQRLIDTFTMGAEKGAQVLFNFFVAIMPPSPPPSPPELPPPPSSPP
jgi:hypothetical protein